MVNLVAARAPLVRGLMKMAGVRPYYIEIETGTVMHFWVPSKTKTHTLSNTKPTEGQEYGRNSSPPDKPAVVLLHGFAGDGILTWLFQIGALTRDYAVYVPDLLFFGGSSTDREERSPAFQAECLAKGLRKLGVETCTLVGFSYGGMVSFQLAELHPELVRAVVVTGSVVALTEFISDTVLQRLGLASWAELLLPTTVSGLKALLSVGTYKKLWFPDFLCRDYLQDMFTNRKERHELLEGLVISNKDPIPHISQRVHLLWGEDDEIIKQQLALEMKQQLGEKATFEGIKKAGHLVQLERPCVYNRCLKQFLASVHAVEAQK